MTELRNGDLYLVYYGGEGEYAAETAVFGSRRKKGETQWSTPKPIAHDPFRSVGNGVIWEAPDGLVWLFYVVRYGETWSTSRVQFKVSRDRAETWSDASVLSLDEGDDGPQPADRARRTATTSCPSTTRPATTPRPSAPTAPRSSSGSTREDGPGPRPGRSGRRGGTSSRPWSSSTTNHLVAYCRRGGDYGPKTIGYIVRAESHDGGRTWTEGKDSAFPNPNAAVDFLKLKSGRLLLVYNDSMTRRTPLTAALSTDQDRTWPVRRNIREGERTTSATRSPSRPATAGSTSSTRPSGGPWSTTRCSTKSGLFMAGERRQIS